MKSDIKFSLVGTPIGNLSDISARAINTLTMADVVYAEDTRTALKLMSHLGLKKKIISCHKDNEHRAVSSILDDINAGLKLCYISEAGMPCISDPGSIIVKALIENNIEFDVVPGATALINALISSGFAGGAFHFYGFLPTKNSDRLKAIKELKKINSPIIFYEAPHRIKDTLAELLEQFPVPISISREITKIYEETMFINNLADIENITVKGEFVVVVNNKVEEEVAENNYEELAKNLLNEDLSQQDIIKVLKTLGMKRNDAYQLMLKLA